MSRSRRNLVVVLSDVAWGVDSARRLSIIALLSCLYGSLLELAQNWVPGRTASLSVALSSVIGVAAGCLIVLAWLWCLADDLMPMHNDVVGSESRGA